MHFSHALSDTRPEASSKRLELPQHVGTCESEQEEPASNKETQAKNTGLKDAIRDVFVMETEW
jgi:hypothetical protein